MSPPRLHQPHRDCCLALFAAAINADLAESRLAETRFARRIAELQARDARLASTLRERDARLSSSLSARDARLAALGFGAGPRRAPQRSAP